MRKSTVWSRNHRVIHVLPKILLLPYLLWNQGAQAGPPALSFTDLTAAAGFTYQHGFVGMTDEDFPLSEFFRRASGGVAAGDYDRDGDIDLFVANNAQAPALYRNDGGNQSHFLNVHLVRPGAGRTLVGSRVSVTVGAVTQMREISVGSNFVSQNLQEAHFGLGTATTVDELQVLWPDGTTDTYSNVAADQFLEIAPTRIFTDGFESGDVSAWTSAAPVVP